jgi:hypothetical protein
MASWLRVELKGASTVLEEMEYKCRESESMNRRVGRWYYWGSIVGGMMYVAAVLGRRWRMTLWKTVLIGYTINPAMVMSGTIGLYLARDYIIE